MQRIQLFFRETLTFNFEAEQYRFLMYVINLCTSSRAGLFFARSVDPLRASVVGKFLDCDMDDHDNGALLAAWAPLLDAERDLAFLLGLHARGLARATPRQPAEDAARAWLSASLLRGGLQGLQPPNPFEEEKTEARSANSTAGTPGTTPTEAKTPQLTTTDRSSAFLQSLAESRIMVSVGGPRTLRLRVASWINLPATICSRYPPPALPRIGRSLRCCHWSSATVSSRAW